MGALNPEEKEKEEEIMASDNGKQSSMDLLEQFHELSKSRERKKNEMPNGHKQIHKDQKPVQPKPKQ